MKTYSAILIVYTNTRMGIYGKHFYYFDFEAKDSAEAKNKLLAECRKRLKRFKVRSYKYAVIACNPLLENRRPNGRKLIRNREKFSSLPTILNPRMTAEKLFIEGAGPKAWAEVIKK